MLFVGTFVPWVLKRLVYYEVGRATGIRSGDGDEMADGVSQTAMLHPYALARDRNRKEKS